MTREEHLNWCKGRALAFCDANDPSQAVASMMSDMRKHDETKDHIALMLMAKMLLGGFLKRNDEVRRFIDGFN